MAVQFLSDDYMEAATAALGADAAFGNATANVSLGIQFQVTEAPEGEVAYYLTIGNGSAEMATGTLEGADVTIASSYETAVSLSKGDLNTQMAFMTGKIKVSGNMAVLMMNQGAINAWSAALAGLDVAY
jgi:putative sterol carrier protein